MVNNLAFVFAGQGAQKVGMCHDLYEKFESAKKIIDNSCEILGYDIKETMFSGPQDKLNQTVHAQPALYIAGSVCLTCFKEQLGEAPEPLFTAGLSLGEYTACAFSGVFSYEDGLRLVKVRAELMQESCDKTDGAMASVIGLKQNDMEDIVKDISDEDNVVVISNYNSNTQYVISGEKKAVEKASEAARGKGAKRVIPLQVAGAYHSPLMEHAYQRMKPVLDETDISPAECKIVSNFNATPYSQPDEIREALKEQLIKPVLWKQSLDYFENNNVSKVYEFGPGAVTVGIMKRLYPDIDTVTISAETDL